MLVCPFLLIYLFRYFSSIALSLFIRSLVTGLPLYLIKCLVKNGCLHNHQLCWTIKWCLKCIEFIEINSCKSIDCVCGLRYKWCRIELYIKLHSHRDTVTNCSEREEKHRKSCCHVLTLFVKYLKYVLIGCKFSQMNSTWISMRKRQIDSKIKRRCEKMSEWVSEWASERASDNEKMLTVTTMTIMIRMVPLLLPPAPTLHTCWIK